MGRELVKEERIQLDELALVVYRKAVAKVKNLMKTKGLSAKEAASEIAHISDLDYVKLAKMVGV